MAGIFISYRRNDSAAYAGRIHDRLAARFGGEAVFMDIGGITPGADFTRVIDARIQSCSAVLAVIGERWLEGGGERRLERPDDPVRREIETALGHGRAVIPVLVGAASMPASTDLPESLRSLAALNAIRVTHEMFDESMTKLIEALAPGEHLRTKQPARALALPAALAVAGTIGTILFFNSSMLTASVPIGPGESLFIFVCWLAPAAALASLIGRVRSRRRSV